MSHVPPTDGSADEGPPPIVPTQRLFHLTAPASEREEWLRPEKFRLRRRLDEQGRLVVRTQAGKFVNLNAGTARLRRPGFTV